MEWPQATHLDDDGDGRQRDHFYYQRGDVAALSYEPKFSEMFMAYL